MSTLHRTKSRIRSVESTRKITKAMELVASVKLKKHQRVLDNIKSYLSTLQEIITTCFKGMSFEESSLPVALKHFPNANKKLLIVVSSSLGLCGGYNYNIFKFTDTIYKKGDKLYLLGSKGEMRYQEEENKDTEDIDLLDHIDYDKVKEFAKKILKEYETGEYTSCVLIYTSYRNSITFEPKTFPLFPLVFSKEEEDFAYPPLYEPSQKVFLENIIPKYIETMLYGKLIETLVSEQASRRNAMDNATDNADELVAKLTLQYNKARQASITNELIDVVAGARNQN